MLAFPLAGVSLAHSDVRHDKGLPCSLQIERNKKMQYFLGATNLCISNNCADR